MLASNCASFVVAEPLGERRHPAERLHHAHTGQALLEGGEVVPDALADLEVCAVGLTPEPAGRPHDRRDDDQRRDARAAS